MLSTPSQTLSGPAAWQPDGNMSAAGQPRDGEQAPSARRSPRNGKLYMMGGRWDSITVQDFQALLVLPLAVSILGPWLATNRPHTVAISIQSADAAVLAEQHRHLAVGRPAEIEPGTSQRSLLAARQPVPAGCARH
jgi:hypothetical protein